MRSRLNKRGFGLTVAATFMAGMLSHTAAAQDNRVYVPTGAGGRFVKLIDPKTRVSGYNPAAVQSFRQKVTRILAQLEAMPQVNSPPEGICHQLGSWIEMHGALGARVLGGEINVMRPLEYRNGRCIKTNNGLVIIGLNKVNDLVNRQNAMIRDAEGTTDRDWFIADFQTVVPGRIELTRNRQQVVAFTRPDVSLFRPVSARRFLEEMLRREAETSGEIEAQRQENRITEADIEKWRREERPRLAAQQEASLNEMRTILTPQQIASIRTANAEGLRLQEQVLLQRLEFEKAHAAKGPPANPQVAEWQRQLQMIASSDMPACVKPGAYADLDLSGRCEGSKVVEINPGYFDTGRPGDIQLLTLVTPLRADDRSEPSRTAIWKALDMASLQAMVR